MELTELLEGIGLTKGEIRVYLALNKLGSSTVGAIIDKAEISSSKVYVILEKLIQKGLVSSTLKNNIKIYHAQDPERLLDFIERKEKELNNKKEKVKKILPTLQAESKESTPAVVEVLEGRRAFINIHLKLTKSMKKGETIYSMTDHTFAKEYAAFLEEINKTRGKLGVKLNLVYSYENWNQKSRHNLRKKRRLFYPKVLPEGFKIPSRIIVYKDTTVISVFAKEPIITVIRNKDFSYSQKQYIKMLWKIAKTPEGYEDSYNQ